MYLERVKALVLKSFTKYFVQRYLLGKSTFLFVWESFFDGFLILFSCGKHHYSQPATFGFVFPPPAIRPAAGCCAGHAAPHSSRHRNIPSEDVPGGTSQVSTWKIKSPQWGLQTWLHAQPRFLVKMTKNITGISKKQCCSPSQEDLEMQKICFMLKYSEHLGSISTEERGGGGKSKYQGQMIL